MIKDKQEDNSKCKDWIGKWNRVDSESKGK